MPQIAIDLDKELDKIVRLYMVENDLSSKEKAIINIIKDSKVYLQIFSLNIIIINLRFYNQPLFSS